MDKSKVLKSFVGAVIFGSTEIVAWLAANSLQIFPSHPIAVVILASWWLFFANNLRGTIDDAADKIVAKLTTIPK